MKRTPKTFRVREIITLADGRIILNGDQGSIDLVRHGERHSSAQWHTVQYPFTDQERAQFHSHGVRISEIPLTGSIAF